MAGEKNMFTSYVKNKDSHGNIGLVQRVKQVNRWEQVIQARM
jgi:hypothetical protein